MMKSYRNVFLLPLGKDLSSDLLVHNDSNCVLSYIENTASLTVVELVRHAFLKGTIAFNVHNVVLLVHLQESGQGLNTMFPEFTREKVARTTAVSLRVDHLEI